MAVEYPEYNLFLPITSAKQAILNILMTFNKLMNLLDDKSFKYVLLEFTGIQNGHQ